MRKLTTGFNSTGIYARANGDVTVGFGSASTKDLFSNGVAAESTSGNVSVTGTSVNVAGVASNGVHAPSGAGNVTVSVGTITTASVTRPASTPPPRTAP